MAAITTLSTNLLLHKLQTDFPNIHFQKGDDFKWSPLKKTVFFLQLETAADAFSLLHELAHGLLEHTNYQTDIELLAKEADAWHHARSVLGPQYATVISQTYIEDQLDTYRDWLHLRSRCPQCLQSGVQTQKSTYQCFNCSSSWNVNDARTCALRRYLHA